MTTPSRSTGKAFWTTIVKSDMELPRPTPRTSMLRRRVALSVAAVIWPSRNMPTVVKPVPTIASSL